MRDAHRNYEIRCPIHGFIPISDWEREIVSQPAFQRLRRVRQLAWTDQVYPGAMHTRFEHSLGVMHIASQLYDTIVRRSGELLKSACGYDDPGLRRDRVLVRLAALLHDIGHGPFSHAGEELLPHRPDSNKQFAHEDYSAAIIRHELRDAIEQHPLNGNYDLKADDVASLIEGSARGDRRIFWRELIVGQMDADRMDYLLRDSLHAGVDYGKYDWRRLRNGITAVEMPRTSPDSVHPGLRLGIDEGSIHAAEGLLLARYFMFTQVYFHKTRVAFDRHLREALREMLPEGKFPPPEQHLLKDFLAWDDWKVLGALASGSGGIHGRRLAERNHFREVYHTPECPTPGDSERLERIESGLAGAVAAREEAGKSWYKMDVTDIPVVSESAGGSVKPLSAYSPVIRSMQPTRRVSLYAEPEKASAARARVAELLKEER